eukprot:359060-Chlamydomonas_euryale.AAC.6
MLYRGTPSQPFSTRCRRPPALQTGSYNPSSAPTMPTCAGSPAWADGRTAPSTQQLSCGRSGSQSQSAATVAWHGAPA